jgi:LEA14-like dessication related protein
MNKPQFVPRRWIVIAILGSATFLQACAGMRTAYETPSVTVTSFRPADSSGPLPNFEINLHVINPNLEPLELLGIAYTVNLNGHDFIKGVGNDLPIIEGYGEGDFTLTASTNLFAGIRILRGLVHGSEGNMRYELEAKLDVGAFHPAIRVKDSGEFSLRGAVAQQ